MTGYIATRERVDGGRVACPVPTVVGRLVGSTSPAAASCRSTVQVLASVAGGKS